MRDHIDPSKDLGHSDRHGKKKKEESQGEPKEESKAEAKSEVPSVTNDESQVKRNLDGSICEDCR